MKVRRRTRAITFVVALLASPVVFALPPIHSIPVIDTPTILMWPADRGNVIPNLNDANSNILNDLHGQISSCDLVLSTEGNYHPALRDIWPVFLAKFKDAPLQNWMYSTSPPIVVPQIAHKQLQFGNLDVGCMPSVAVASKLVMDKLAAAGQNDGPAIPLYQDRGDVILVKHGNPKHIRSVWDLGRADVHIVTPNPNLEQGAFASYATTIYGIASQDRQAPTGMTADKLFDRLFNANTSTSTKWFAGERIHHRDVPWSIAYGHADAGVILYHLARYMQETFPDKFDIVPLGGSVEDPKPLPGTRTAVRYVVRLKGDWSPRQIEARDKLIDTLLSDEFTEILKHRGLERPQPMVP